MRGSVREFCPESVKGLPCLALHHWFFPGRLKATRALGEREDRPLVSAAVDTQKEGGNTGPDQGGLGTNTVAFPWRYRYADWGAASAQGPLEESVVTCQGEAIHRTAHRAKSASSDRSGFFRFEVFEAGAGASVGGEGRSGTVSAALALSSRNLSNSSLVTPSSRSSPFISELCFRLSSAEASPPTAWGSS